MLIDCEKESFDIRAWLKIVAAFSFCDVSFALKDLLKVYACLDKWSTLSEGKLRCRATYEKTASMRDTVGAFLSCQTLNRLSSCCALTKELGQAHTIAQRMRDKRLIRSIVFYFGPVQALDFAQTGLARLLIPEDNQH